MQDHSKVTCAECRSEVTVATGGVKNLPNNYFISHLVNKLILSHKLESEKELSCEEMKMIQWLVIALTVNYSFVVTARSLTSIVKVTTLTFWFH